jgi:hypothetical protein
MTLKIFLKRTRAISKIKCPYCKGTLHHTSHYLWDFDCSTCDRAWKVIGDTFTALFDAAPHLVYDATGCKVCQ